jgi:hypothetical protein
MGTVTQRNLANVRDALGGSNPVSMSQYYRGGARVPTTRTTNTREPASGDSYSNSPPIRYWYIGGTSAYMRFDPYIGQVQVGGSGTTSYSSGGATYFRGSYVGCCGCGFIQLYGVYRTSTTTVSINTGVPSSGAISINQLLGAENP